MISSIIFSIVFLAALVLFALQIRKIRRNIGLGLPVHRTDRMAERIQTTIRVAFGQSKMVARPVAGIFHILIYAGFVLINIEVLEIIVDGFTGGHRTFQPYLGNVYTIAIAFFEILGIGVFVACVLFLARRLGMGPKRLQMKELDGWPKKDGNIILITECVLMLALFTLDAVDVAEGKLSGVPVGAALAPLFAGLPHETLHLIAQIAWWFHLVGILAFLNYLPVSKHFHIILAFPNVFFSNLHPKGKFTNLEAVTKEVKLMMDPSADPYAAPPENAAPVKFGAKDVQDLNWKNLLDAYSCTECGRCTSECPANQTGKLLSPRRIMMATRDRLEDVGKQMDKHGKENPDGKSLLGDYITEEELWACTSCNACVEACPVNINPLEIIMELRRDLVMEQSKAPGAITTMFTNIENNGAPWQFSPADRANWTQELNA